MQRPRQRSAVARWPALALAILLVSPLAAGATAPGSSRAAETSSGADDADLAVDPLRLTPEMSRFLRQNLRLDQPRAALLRSLIDLIFAPTGLGITYGNTRTRTAAETFASRSGNCLSFTLMFVAMARHLGFSAYFVEVDEVTSWDQRGEVLVNNKHMYAEVELHNGLYQVDFLPGIEKRYLLRRRIGDERARAHYFNNVGAERLSGMGAAAALPWLERSLSLDDGFSAAWTNLGVARRRLGDLDAAEASLRRAIALDSRADAARSNLAALYQSTGREALAETLLAEVERHHEQNPFHHFRLGLAALAGDRPEAAISHLRDAIRRQGDEPVFHLQMAIALHRGGRLEEARASFERALALSDEPAEKERWRSAWLAATGGADREPEVGGSANG